MFFSISVLLEIAAQNDPFGVKKLACCPFAVPLKFVVRSKSELSAIVQFVSKFRGSGKKLEKVFLRCSESPLNKD